LNGFDAIYSPFMVGVSGVVKTGGVIAYFDQIDH